MKLCIYKSNLNKWYWPAVYPSKAPGLRTLFFLLQNTNVTDTTNLNIVNFLLCNSSFAIECSKSPKSSKSSKSTDIDDLATFTDEQKCAEYCDLLIAAKARCPYASHIGDNRREDEDASCIDNCMNANFSKNGSDQDFVLKDTIQCRMNHAKMAIKEGALTNSNHCLHASIPGPERCVEDVTSLSQNGIHMAGKYYFYGITSALQDAGTDMSKIFQVYFAIVQYLVALRGRLYVQYPYLADEDEYYTDTTAANKESMVRCTTSAQVKYRTPDGTCNNFDMPLMGSTSMPFAHSLKPSGPIENGSSYADVSKVAEILKRPHGEPHPDTLAPFNQLASAWIQFMTHDWFQHDNSEESCGGSLHNRVTHWWDASQIYGSSQTEENRIRVDDGKIHLDDNDELDYDENGTPRTGFGDNFWVGLHVFHTIFAREHNFIVDSLGVAYPGMTSDEKYGVARLCVSAILAKIHTIEWTPTLLDNSASTLAMNINW